ncbi:phage protease [Acinetobacter baumannii]|uniref:phage protease n=1 Tax=Acinetobacter baumannii TaxID=470 RepID=UPI00233F5658|nr:phage protease [Acinetobacter baumannii]MDC3808476.1 phage protease [Acinetobacter baumannii]MDC4004343.1 phage protease [Acinetobacter baumannii]MDC4053966.1 phage protease [Acinetobacter baumannii]MDC4140161.1 phage protease [Acinetobacter baumannii]MDC4159846.1 phage protease [Acinetobacter baumannii]
MPKSILVASCSIDLNATSTHLVLVPEGTFNGVDGRPFDAPHWVLTPERGEQIVAALNQRKVDMVIDYEHATLKAQETGEPAPASGWLKAASFSYIKGVGICSTNFKWLDKAKEHIEKEEYKYLSPVLFYIKNTGEVVGLHSVALTNTPNLDNLPEAQLAALAQDYFIQNSPQDSEMEELLEQLRWMLNLPLSATAEEILAELNKLSAQIKEKTGVAVAANGQHLFDALAAIDQLKLAANSQDQVDMTQFVPMAVYQEAVANAGNAEAAQKAKEIDDLIVAACSDGRLTGQATIEWVKEQAKTNPDFVKAHIESLPKIAALTQRQTEQVNLAANHQQQPVVDEIATSIATQLGLNPADLGANP